jgi:non-homologous end joining protein Ku
VDQEAVALAKELVKAQSGEFEPEKMPDDYAVAVKELVAAKVEQRAPKVTVGKGDAPAPKVINIMAALKQSVEAKGRAKVRAAVRKRAGRAAAQPSPSGVQRGKGKLKPRRLSH